MEKKIFTVAVIGAGARGAGVYSPLIAEKKDCFDIVAVCDIQQERLDDYAQRFGVKPENCFLDENVFFAKKRADLLLVTTQDPDHVGHCLKGFALGYDIMTEKPLTDKREECTALLEAQKKYGGKALVCHVLRYAPAFLKAAELLNSGVIGDLVLIQALERVGFAHQAHSYVRGNWRNTDIAAPMILAKCCHDLDLLQFYAKSKCKSISSVGDLVYFKAENKPANAAKRCIDCPLIESCEYSCKKRYIDAWHYQGCPVDQWPFSVFTSAPITEEKLYQAMKEGPYGKCVFDCDNNVVDHEFTMMTFENGVKATLTMTAFTANGGRRYHFHGTKGELILEEQENKITVQKFDKPMEVIEMSDLTEKGYGHGGGDYHLIESLYDTLIGKGSAETSLERSVESHLMGICAEESRLKGGELIYVHKD
ncbi:MAG: Gfo/Idh/MocA family oxidoreductase [Clostridia bacterium]|nr:Gfo/Idh/MocA family oxidoreductase [Clostridia bacterium]